MFGKKKQETQQLEANPQASVADADGKHDDSVVDAISLEANALEAHINDDPSAAAMLQLADFHLTPGAQHLLDAGLDNLSQSTGQGIEDADQRMLIRERAELVKLTGNDFNLLLQVLVGDTEDPDFNPKDVAGRIYSVSYKVLGAALFIANLDYRRYLDPRGDQDLSPYIDPREDDPSAPYGLDTSVDREFEWLRSTYGSDFESMEDVFACSLVDLRNYLQLNCEAFGWDPAQVMPFANVMEKNGSFTPITDVRNALDHSEIKRQESRKRRTERESNQMKLAQERARKMLADAGKRKAAVAK